MQTTSKLLIALFFFLFGTQIAEGQVGINILQPDTSAVLHLESTDRGFLPPRMTQAQRDAIFQPQPGLQIYNTDVEWMQYWNGTCWLYDWQEDCDACLFDFEIAQDTGAIDRVLVDTVAVEVTVTQLGTPQNVGLILLHNLPPEITVSLDQATINGDGTAEMTVYSSIFAEPGDYTIVIQALCGGTIKNVVYTVTIEPCVEVTLTTNQTNYDLQAANGLPTSTPICVVLTIQPGINVVNDANGTAALTSGNLDPDSHVGIDLNNGAILARGGDGGIGGNFSNFGAPGEDGTDALELTVRAEILNNGYIFGGGGGGGSVGLGVNIPVIGNWAIGGGGGGGAALGEGGEANIVNLPVWEDGEDATGGITGTAGDGGNLTIPISFNISGVDLTVTPNVQGGDGGEYGVDGGSGTAFVNLQISVPFIGNIFNQDFPDPPPSSFPAGGTAGNAIKHNGNPIIGVSDGYYQTNAIKGEVGP